MRADSHLVRIYHRSVLIKIHPRQSPGGRVTHAKDLPAHKTAYAMRDLDHLRRLAASEGLLSAPTQTLYWAQYYHRPSYARSTPCSAS